MNKKRTWKWDDKILRNFVCNEFQIYLTFRPQEATARAPSVRAWSCLTIEPTKDKNFRILSKLRWLWVFNVSPFDCLTHQMIMGVIRITSTQDTWTILESIISYRYCDCVKGVSDRTTEYNWTAATNCWKESSRFFFFKVKWLIWCWHTYLRITGKLATVELFLI